MERQHDGNIQVGVKNWRIMGDK